MAYAPGRHAHEVTLTEQGPGAQGVLFRDGFIVFIITINIVTDTVMPCVSVSHALTQYRGMQSP